MHLFIFGIFQRGIFTVIVRVGCPDRSRCRQAPVLHQCSAKCHRLPPTPSYIAVSYNFSNSCMAASLTWTTDTVRFYTAFTRAHITVSVSKHDDNFTIICREEKYLIIWYHQSPIAHAAIARLPQRWWFWRLVKSAFSCANTKYCKRAHMEFATSRVRNNAPSSQSLAGPSFPFQFLVQVPPSPWLSELALLKCHRVPTHRRLGLKKLLHPISQIRHQFHPLGRDKSTNRRNKILL